MLTIYLILNQVNEKIYVGQTMASIERRLREHKKAAKSGKYSSYLHSAMRLYGFKYFTIHYLANGGETRESANAAEQFWVSRLRANDDTVGYNLTSGGDAGWTMSEAARRKIGDATRKPNLPFQKCRGCGAVKPLTDYHINRAVSNGRMGRCRECTLREAAVKYQEGEGKERKERREAIRKEKESRTEKWCGKCQQFLPMDSFYPSKIHTDGHLGTCKKCRNLGKRRSPHP